METHELIRALREDRDLSQTEVGSHVNISQRKLSFIELGRTEPHLDDIRNLCRFFNVSADYLLGLPEGLPYPKRESPLKKQK